MTMKINSQSPSLVVCRRQIPLKVLKAGDICSSAFWARMTNILPDYGHLLKHGRLLKEDTIVVCTDLGRCYKSRAATPRSTRNLCASISTPEFIEIVACLFSCQLTRRVFIQRKYCGMGVYLGGDLPPYLSFWGAQTRKKGVAVTHVSVNGIIQFQCNKKCVKCLW